MVAAFRKVKFEVSAICGDVRSVAITGVPRPALPRSDSANAGFI